MLNSSNAPAAPVPKPSPVTPEPTAAVPVDAVRPAEAPPPADASQVAIARFVCLLLMFLACDPRLHVKPPPSL